ncbi:hypothetical protein [Geobacter sp. SVR]|nr:hypothetical protein [Geobacter sp. SVR]
MRTTHPTKGVPNYMAAGDFTPSRLGQQNATGDALANFLKVFAGEILTAFEIANIMLNRHHIRTIQSGKSAQFPVMGRAVANYHTPGAALSGQSIKHNEEIITIDGLLVADVFLSNLDEAMNHYDVRGPYAKELGNALKVAFDKNVLQEGILGARASNKITGLPGGTQIKNNKLRICTGGAANMTEKYTAIAESLFLAAQYLASNNVTEQAYCVLRPAEYYALAQNLNVINNLYGGQGSIAEGNVLKVAGIVILMSNNVPSTDLTGNTFHGGDFTKTIGLVFVESAIGTVKLMDLSIQVGDFDNRYQGHLTTATYAMGHKYLRPDALIELCLDTVTNATA